MTEDEQQKIFKNWLHHYKALIFKIVRAYGATPVHQDDLFQEITMQVWRSIPGFRNEAAVSTWIYRIGLNTAISWLNKEKKHRHTNTLPDILEPTPTPPDDRLNRLYAAIQQLDGIDRSIMLLLLDGCSYKEMAAILGISETHVGVKINRIKKQLKKITHGV